MEIKAKVRDNDRVVAVNYDLGENLKDLVAKFGDESVYSRAKAALVIDIQSIVRKGIDAGKTDAEIQGLVNTWKPGVRLPAEKLTPKERLTRLLAGLSPEERTAFLKEAAGKKAA